MAYETRMICISVSLIRKVSDVLWILPDSCISSLFLLAIKARLGRNVQHCVTLGLYQQAPWSW